jgi:hypothetical protein
VEPLCGCAASLTTHALEVYLELQLRDFLRYRPIGTSPAFEDIAEGGRIVAKAGILVQRPIADGPLEDVAIESIYELSLELKIQSLMDGESFYDRKVLTSIPRRSC